MIVGLNATCISSRPSGAKQRFLGIYGALIRNNPNIEFIVFEPVDYTVGRYFDFPNVVAVRTPIPSEGWLHRYYNGLGYWKKALSKYRFDIFENINHALVKSPTGRRFLTVHDIRYINNPSSDWSKIIFSPAVLLSMYSADQIITVSEAMKGEIMDIMPRANVAVIYNGIAYEAFDSIMGEQVEEVKRKYELPRQFLLTVGHLERRKNYKRLVAALYHLRQQGFGHKLVIVGNDSGEGTALRKTIAEYGLQKDVLILSNLTNRELRCVYKLADLFVFPSEYEGFGIPILEAMAAEIPMVMSDIPVFREITQNQGSYFPFDDPFAMSEKIAEGLSSDEKREAQIQYGTKRIVDFSFEEISKKLEALYFRG